MSTHDPRVDAYILRAAAFAQPILRHIRERMDRYGAEITETMRWGFPHFDYQGRIFCGMAAFKAHCAFYFHNGDALSIKARSSKAHTNGQAMGQFGRITAIADLPSDAALARLVKQAMQLRDSAHIAKPATPKKTAKPLVIPDYFLAALKKNRAAQITFDAFSPSNKRDYVEWITGAKTEVTRDRRLVQALAWLAEGKVRNWKYLPKERQKQPKTQ